MDEIELKPDLSTLQNSVDLSENTNLTPFESCFVKKEFINIKQEILDEPINDPLENPNYLESEESKCKLSQEQIEKHNISDIVPENHQKYDCEICGKSLATEKSLNVHISINHENHSEISDNYCKMCHKNFTSRYNLKRHIFTVHKNAQKVLIVPFSIVRQNENHSEITENNCELCQKTFSSTSNLNRHIKLVHKTEQNVCKKVPIHKCDLCGKSFSLPQKLQSHIISAHYGNKGIY